MVSGRWAGVRDNGREPVDRMAIGQVETRVEIIDDQEGMTVISDERAVKEFQERKDTHSSRPVARNGSIGHKTDDETGAGLKSASKAVLTWEAIKVRRAGTICKVPIFERYIWGIYQAWCFHYTYGRRLALAK